VTSRSPLPVRKVRDVLAGEWGLMSQLPSKVWRYARSEGVSATAARVLTVLADAACLRQRFLIYRLDLARAVPGGESPSCAIDELGPEHSRELAQVTDHSADEIRTRFGRGDRCFVAKRDGYVAHYLWICFSEGAVIPLARPLPLSANDAYLYNARTLRPFRRQRIFSRVLLAVARRLRHEGIERLWAGLDARNVPSQRGVLSLGFRLVREIDTQRAFGITLRRHWRVELPEVIAEDGGMTVRVCSPDEPVWQGYVDAHDSVSPFHLPGWGRIVAETTGHMPCTLVAERDCVGVGILPLTLVTSRLAGRALVSQPFAMGGVACIDAAAGRTLLRSASGLAYHVGADYLEVRQHGPHTLEYAGELGFRPRQLRSSFVLNLEPGESSLWRSLCKKAQNGVRRAERSGVTVTCGAGNREFSAFCKLMSASTRRLGSLVYGNEFYRRIIEEFANDARFFVAYASDHPLAAALALRFKDEMHLLWEATDVRAGTLGADDLLTWSVIQHSVQVGLSELNFGRSIPASGSAAFKGQWLTEDVPLTWWLPVNSPEIPDFHPDGKSRRLARAIWRRLPLAVTSRLGPHLARQIP
jgi:FemAB-related protein (PEP-CTERM system-associated)